MAVKRSISCIKLISERVSTARTFEVGLNCCVKAVKLIRPTSSVIWHPVSVLVNNSRNNSAECMQPVDLQSVWVVTYCL